MALNILSKALHSLRPIALGVNQQCPIYSVAQNLPTDAAPGGTWSMISVRTNIRNHFPRPSEAKRIRKHGWKTRMSTANGRAIIWRRILKGKFVLTH